MFGPGSLTWRVNGEAVLLQGGGRALILQVAHPKVAAGVAEFSPHDFRRTFVEKLFAIHAKVELLKERGTALGPYARHYYDLHQLAGRSEVRAMLESCEYAEIKADYDRISRAAFPRDFRPPEGMSFAHSDALFPPAALEAQLRRNFEEQCRQLCYGKAPTWADVRASFDALRDLL